MKAIERLGAIERLQEEQQRDLHRLRLAQERIAEALEMGHEMDRLLAQDYT
jgi:hypothetical protein